MIIYLIKKEDAFLQDQAKEALNWSITAMIAYMAAIVLSFVVIGVFLSENTKVKAYRFGVSFLQITRANS